MSHMHPTDKLARIAGATYLSMLPLAPFALIYVPSKLIVRGDAEATAARVLGSEMMFRFSIVADMLATIVFLMLALILYRLFQNVSQFQSMTMSTLAIVSGGMSLANAATSIAALTLFRGGTFLDVFTAPQRNALGMLFLRMHSQGILVNELLWGLWLLPFGLLVMKSRFLPRFLGVLLIVNCIAYVTVSITGILAPGATHLLNPWATIAETGELWVTLWLLVKGADMRRVPEIPSNVALA